MNSLIKTLLTGLVIFTGFFSHAYSIDFGELPKEEDEKKQKSRTFMQQTLPDFKDKRSLLKKADEEIDPDMPYVTDFPIDESEYVVGPGDLFEIHIEEDKHFYEVNPEGNIVLENIGVVPVADSILAVAKKALLKKIQSVNKNINCYVNLKRPKTMFVFVTGAVNIPGVHRTRGNIRVSDLIVHAKWFRPDAQKGTVKITSKTGTSKTVDLGKFLIHGDLENNPYITQGDIIYVPFIDYSKPYVTIRRNNTTNDVQLEEDDTLEDLLAKHQGYQAYTPPNSVVVREISRDEKVIPRNKLMKYTPSNHAFIDVSENMDYVYVGGAVQNPGFIPYKKGSTALNYIAEAGLQAESKVGNKVQVHKKDGRKESIKKTSTNLLPGDALIVKQNFEQKLLLYSPILISIASLTIAVATLLRQ